MNNIHEEQKSYAKQLVEEASALESQDPVKAKYNLLQAAEIFVKLSYADKVNEDRLLAAAELLANRAQHIGEKRSSITPINNEFTSQKSGITFDEVIGVDSVKEQLELAIILPFKHPEVYKHYNKKMKGGIVMYGPPGCGKSMIAEAAANEAGLTFFHVKPSDIMNKYVGETEKNLSELFEKARSQPSIIFFDEFEVLGGDRSTATQHTKEVISQLLTEMDGLGTKDQKIFCIAATNEPWNIDIALMREGRFGTSIFVPPPDIHGRAALFQHHLKGRPIEAVDYYELAKLTKLWSGADIKGACEKAVSNAIKESLKTKKVRNITQQDLLDGIKSTHSTTQTWLRKAREQIQKNHDTERFSEIVEFDMLE